jgi:ankyrin repeat protein
MNTTSHESILTPLEINYLLFKNKSHEEIKQASLECRLPITNAVINNDYETVRNYVDDPKYSVENNLERQTPLMLAAMLSNPDMVRLLLREAGMMDHEFNQAIDFTTSPEIKELLSEYGELAKE